MLAKMMGFPGPGAAAHRLTGHAGTAARPPGAHLGRAARRAAQHHPADCRTRLLDQNTVPAMDHHCGVQRHLCRAPGRHATACRCSTRHDSADGTAGGPDPAPPTPEPAPSPEALRAALPGTTPLAPLVRALESGDSIIIFPKARAAMATIRNPSSRACSGWPRCFRRWCWCPPGSTTCSASFPRARWCRCPFLCSVTFGAPVQLEPGEERRPFSTGPGTP